jgi:hypothetical protein
MKSLPAFPSCRMTALMMTVPIKMMTLVVRTVLIKVMTLVMRKRKIQGPTEC